MKITKIQRWFLRFIQVQLFITTISLPILLSWGLPISLLSPLGNLIFFPVLVLFLLLSSLVFFFEIIHIPNEWLIYCLEKVTLAWFSILSIGNGATALIGFSKPPKLFLIALPLLTFGIIYNKRTNSLGRSIILLFFLLVSACIYLKLINKTETLIKQIPCNNGSITLIHTKGTTTVIDPGVIGRKVSASSWVNYTLVPEIIQKGGSNRIDHLILLQPGIRIFNAVEKLCNSTKIKNIYLIRWKGKLNKNGWRSFFFMKRAAKKQGTRITEIGRWKRTVHLSETAKLTIEPVEQQLSYQEATYPAVRISGQIDNQTFTFYSAKYKNKAQKMSQN